MNLPIFVYGTLRTDQGNYNWALAGRTTSEVEATMSGMVMHDQGGFPFAYPTEDPADVIVGDLMRIRDDLYQETLASLDGLEGYFGPQGNNLYERGIRTVTLADGTNVEAYTYFASDYLYTSRVHRLPRIESGDWIDYDTTRFTRARASA